MPTKNPRVNVTIDSEIDKALTVLSKNKNKSISLIARELIEQALELKEDIFFSKIAEERDIENQEMISHEDAWK